MKIKVDLRVPVGQSIPQLAEFIKGCEAVGFHGVGVHDHQDTARDVFVTLAVAATKSSRLVLYPSVTNPITRHPMVLASLAHSLEEVAPGRTLMAIGIGDMAATHIGQRRATVEELRNAVNIIRRLLRGESLPFGNSPSEYLLYTSPKPTPVYVTGSSVRSVELAGEVGDGAFIMVGLDKGTVAAARRHIAQGAQRTGRDAKSIPVIFSIPVHIEPTMKKAREWANRWFASRLGSRMLSRWFPYWLQAAGITPPKDAKDLTEKAVARICDAIGLFGSPEHCAERLLQANEEAGVDRIFLMSAHDVDTQYIMPETERTAFEKVIFPRIGL